MSRTHVGANLSETGPDLEAPQHAARAAMPDER
jgi:hypothetical protein